MADTEKPTKIHSDNIEITVGRGGLSYKTTLTQVLNEHDVMLDEHVVKIKKMENKIKRLEGKDDF